MLLCVCVAGGECVYLRANRSSMAWEKGIQVPYPFFVFAWHWKTDLNFSFCFSFSPNFEKRFWTSYSVFRFQYQFSFFVFASVWKTDMNFVFRFSFSHYFEKRIWIFRFLITLKNRSEFRLSFWHDFEKRITAPVQSFEAPATPRGWPGHSLFM